MTQNPHTVWFRDTLYTLGRFSGMVEEMLQREVAKLEAHLDAQAASLEAREKAEYFEYHAEDFFELSTQLPTIHRYSVITAADSALEIFLTDTCNSYAKLTQASLRLDDLAGKGLRRAQQYLKKVASIDFPDSLSAWVSILRLRDLRNCIVHADGQIAEDRIDLIKWIKAEDGISISANGTVTFFAPFTSKALSWYEAFAEAFDGATKPLGLWATVLPFEAASS